MIEQENRFDAIDEALQALREDQSRQLRWLESISQLLVSMERRVDGSAPSIIRLSDREACRKHLGYAPSYVRQLAREKGAPLRSPGHGSVQVVILSEWIEWIAKMTRVV